MAADHQRSEPPARTGSRASDASGWNWLLPIPIVLCLLTTLYNRSTPHFLGFPAFYWLQLLFVLVGVASTTTVYRMTRSRTGGRAGDRARSTKPKG